jgi:hypothetical protein
MPTLQQRKRELPEHDGEIIGPRITSLWGFLGKILAESFVRTVLAFVFVWRKKVWRGTAVLTCVTAPYLPLYPRLRKKNFGAATQHHTSDTTQQSGL